MQYALNGSIPILKYLRINQLLQLFCVLWGNEPILFDEGSQISRESMCLPLSFELPPVSKGSDLPYNSCAAHHVHTPEHLFHLVYRIRRWNASIRKAAREGRWGGPSGLK